MTTPTNAERPSDPSPAHDGRPIERITNEGTKFLSVDELMNESERWEDLAWRWCEALLTRGHYDDSDVQLGIIVHYYSANDEMLWQQMRVWLEQHPEFANELELPDRPS